MRLCAYARVSTDSQELSQQIESIKKFCEYKEYQLAALYSEIISGAKAKRPQYLQMVADLRKRLYDGVVVFRIDRLGRNSRELILLLDELRNKGIRVFSINENLDDSTAIGRAMIDFICILANLEREQIQEATKQRLTALRNMGKKLGRPKGAKDRNPNGRRKSGYLLRYAGKVARENFLQTNGNSLAGTAP